MIIPTLVGVSCMIILSAIVQKSIPYEDFDIHHQIVVELSRRLKLLGNLVEKVFEKPEIERVEISKRARAVNVRRDSLFKWYQAYKRDYTDGIKPKEWVEIWNNLDIPVKQQILEEYNTLDDIADSEYVSEDHIKEISEYVGWKIGRFRARLRRYRSAGLIGLAPGHNPDKGRPRTKLHRPLGTFTEEELHYALKKLERLGDLADREHVSNQEIKSRACEVDSSERTLRYDYAAYRKYGLSGLKRNERSDKGKHHNTSDVMIETINSVRISRKRPSFGWVYEQVCRRAIAMGEPVPSKSKVREVINLIPEPLILMADRRWDEFRNKYRVTHPMILGKNDIILQLDITQVSVLVIDKRQGESRSKSGETRPYLSVGLEANSGLLLSAKFDCAVPNRHVIASLIYDAVRISDSKPYGGRFHELWVDRGKQFIANLIEEIAMYLKAIFYKIEPRQPQVKGKIERFFKTVEDELWTDTPGYVGRNVQERDPNVKAVLTIDQLEERFWEYIKGTYHSKRHTDTGLTPIEYWDQNLYGEEVEPENLAVLLMERATRKCSKGLISFQNKKYWHEKLARHAGEQLTIKWGFTNSAPDSVEVFSVEDQWICTAYQVGSDNINTTIDDLSTAHYLQLQHLNAELKVKKKFLADIDKKHNIPSDDDSSIANHDSEIKISPVGKRKMQKDRIKSHDFPKKICILYRCRMRTMRRRANHDYRPKSNPTSLSTRWTTLY